MKQRFAFLLQYHGARYRGWQRQPQGASIQSVLEDALSKEFNEKIFVAASGRTDAGVHALGQVIHFDLSGGHSVSEIRARINRLLPQDIFLASGREVAKEFHAQDSALRKYYVYLVYNRGKRSPFWDDRAWVFSRPLDLKSMAQAARDLRGTHDFVSFRGALANTKTTIRTLYICDVFKKGFFYAFQFEGNGFLKNMVRNMVGTLVEVGQGRRSANSMVSIIKAKDRRAAGRIAPPQGLYLMGVSYPRRLLHHNELE